MCSGPSLAIAQSVTDPEAFAAVAASSDMFEIESSQLALEEASGEEMRAFAEQMAEDYTAAGEKMKAAAQEHGISPPTSMTEKEQSQIEQLQS